MILQLSIRHGRGFGGLPTDQIIFKKKGKSQSITVVNKGKLEQEPDHISREKPTVASYSEHPDKVMAF